MAALKGSKINKEETKNNGVTESLGSSVKVNKYETAKDMAESHRSKVKVNKQKTTNDCMAASQRSKGQLTRNHRR